MQPKDRRLVTEQALEDGVASFDTRIRSIETMSGLAPGQVTDAQTANLVTQTSTQTRTALNQVVNTHLSPVERTAYTANQIATTTAGRVDALEVLTDVTPGNVDDATVALHVNQNGSLARDAVERTILDIPANLFDPTTITEGVIYSQGAAEPTPNSGYNISDWIPVAPGAEYTYGEAEGGSILRVTYFDVTQQYVSDFSFPNNPYTHTTPQNAAWARLSVSLLNTPGAQMNRGPTLLPYDQGGTGKVRAEYLPELPEPGDFDLEDGSVTPEKTTFFEGSSNLFDQNKVTTGMIYPYGAGTPNENSAHSISDWIKVTAGQDYTMLAMLRATWFDTERQYVSNNDTANYTEPHTFTAPTDAAWVRVSLTTSRIGEAQLNAGPTLLPYEPGGTSKIRAEYLPATGPDSPIGRLPYLIDTDGLAETFDGPTVDAQPGLWDSVTTDVYTWYDTLMAAHSDYVSRRDLGTSSDGQPIYAYTLKAPEVPTNTDERHLSDEAARTPYPAALLISGVHGYEPAGVYHLWQFAQDLCENWATSPVLDTIRWNVEVIIVPVAVPYGYDNKIRHNANEVDIARNFPADWVQGTPGTNTYGGTAPLSEPETVALDQLMAEVADRTIFGSSFHTFGTSGQTNIDQIWQAAASPLLLQVGKRLVSRMSRKWHQDHEWITTDALYLGYADYKSPAGSEGRQMASYGFPGATFETKHNTILDGGDGTVYSSRAMTLGYEATVNYIAMALKAGLEHPNTALTFE